MKNILGTLQRHPGGNNGKGYYDLQHRTGLCHFNLTVMRPEIIETIRTKGHPIKVRCICPMCGNEFIALQHHIVKKTGYNKSCGCSHKTASERRRRVYMLPFEKEISERWKSMKSRVKKEWSYIDKGITVCPEWYDFKTFYDWAIIGFDPKLEIDRRDNKRGYSPDNCHWVTRLENLRNRDKQTINEEVAFEIKINCLQGFDKHLIADNLDCSWVIVHSIYINKAWKDVCERAEKYWMEVTGKELPLVVIEKRGTKGKYNIAVRSKTTSREGRNQLYAEYREKRQHIRV